MTLARQAVVGIRREADSINVASEKIARKRTAVWLIANVCLDNLFERTGERQVPDTGYFRIASNCF